MKSRTCRAVAVFLALTIAGASIAQEAPNYAEPGLYMAGQAGAAFLRDDLLYDLKIDSTGDTTRRYDKKAGNQLSVGARLGHRWKNWAIELDGGYVRGEVNIFNVSVNGRWYPLTHRIQPYVLAGLGVSHVRPELVDLDGETQFGGTVFAMVVGAGGEFYFTEHVFTDLGFNYRYLTGPGGREGNNQSFLEVRAALGYRFF